MAAGEGELTVGCVVGPLAPRVNQQNLGSQFPLVPVSELVTVVMVVWSDGSPREFSVVATVMQSGRSSGGGNDGKVRLMGGPLSPARSDKYCLGFGLLLDQPLARQKWSSFSRAFTFGIAPRTAAPRTLMTVSCARELISFAFLISSSSSGVFTNLA
jgi:hypothetical protein